VQAVSKVAATTVAISEMVLIFLNIENSLQSIWTENMSGLKPPTYKSMCQSVGRSFSSDKLGTQHMSGLKPPA
jgi:hypothetical protein